MAPTCPLCFNFADTSYLPGESGGVRAAWLVECRICGRFVAGWVFQKTSASFDQDQRYLLSALTRAANEADGAPLELSDETARQFVRETPWPSLTEQTTTFLSYIERNAKRRGDAVSVDHRKDYPLFYAKGEQEVNFIAREAIDSGWIRRIDKSAVPQYVLTMAGYLELERRQTPMRQPSGERHEATTLTEGDEAVDSKEYDLFLSHASEDKASIADPLFRALTERNVRVWYDNAVLTLGDSLRRKIDEGLQLSRYGVVVLSPAFFAKNWPQRELDGLAARETDEGRKIILPVWHNVSKADVLRYSAPLADKVAVRTSEGLATVRDAVLAAVAGAPDGARVARAGAPLHLDFNPAGQPCVYDFVRHPIRFVGGDEPPPLRYRLLRIRVSNIGRETAREVRVVLEDVQPRSPEFVLSHALTFMDSGAETATIHPGGKAWCDVVQTDGHEVSFQYAREALRQWSVAVSCVLSLRAESSLGTAYGRFRLVFDGAGMAMLGPE